MPSTLSVDSLRTEHKTNPLGIDESRPRLGWKLRSKDRDVLQAAYRITVSSSPRGKGDLWDSGKVASSQSVDVEYAGEPLAKGQRAHWRVQVWDNRGKTAESPGAFWEAGLVSQSNWAAQWIGGPLEGGPRSTVPLPYLRKPFRLAQAPKRARLYVTALGLYEFHLNGKVVGQDVFRPGWTEYAARVQYDVYDVTGLLKKGDNAAAAVLADGWFCGHVAADDRQKYGDRPKLLAQLEIELADGSTQTLLTDGSWKTSTGPILESDMIMGEAYDARKEIPGWDKPGFDDAAWSRVVVFDAPKITINASAGTPVRRIMEIQPVATKQFFAWPMGPWQFDFGQNLVGRVCIKVKGKRGTTLTLKFAEVLQGNKPEGRIYTDNLRSARATDYYTLKGDGLEVWEPAFTFHGFRYVEIAGLKQMTADMVTAVVLHNEMPITGTFECSDKLVNQLQHNIQWGQRGNFLEVPTDCPQRDERLGWMGDAQVFARTAMFNMDVQPFFAKWLLDIRDAQGPGGSIPPVVPGTGSFGTSADGGPAWADAVAIIPWTQYLVYADRRALDRHYAAVVKFLAHQKLNSDAWIRCKPGFKYQDGAWDGFGDWLSTDAEQGSLMGGTPKDLIGTAFFAHSSRLAGKIAKVLGKSKDAKAWEQQFQTIKQAFIDRFVTSDGLLAGRSQTSAVLALHFDLLPDSARLPVLDWLVRNLESRGNKLSTGFVGTPYLQHVLTAGGRTDVAYKLLFQKDWPSWLYAPLHGATTIWERWDGWTHDKGFADVGMNSFNHYAYGAVGDWLYGSVAGIEIDPQKPGYEHILFQPHPPLSAGNGDGLTSAKAALETARGRVSAAWTLKNGQFTYDVEVPPNATATVLLPAGKGAKITESGKKVDAKVRDGRASVKVGSGRYRFAVTG